MKPFFGIDITDDKKNETMNAAPFIVQKPSAAAAWKIEQETDEIISRMKANYKHAGKRARKSVALLLCAAFFGLLALFAVNVAVDVTFALKKVSVSLLCWGAAAVMTGIALLFGILSRRAERTAELEDDKPEHGARKGDPLLRAAFFGLLALFAVVVADAITFDLKKVPFGLLCWGAAAVLFGVAVFFGVRSYKADCAAEQADDEPENDDREDEDDLPPSATASEILAELGVPKTARSVDVIGFDYREKKGRISPRGREGVGFGTVYDCYTFKGYVKDKNLCFACTDEGIFAVPLSELKAIRTVRKKILLPDWTKGKPLTHEQYKPYMLKMVRGGVFENLRVGWYHVLEFVHKGETWGIWFPNYELPAFEKLTGLKADEQSTDCKELFTSDPTV